MKALIGKKLKGIVQYHKDEAFAQQTLAGVIEKAWETWDVDCLLDLNCITQDEAKYIREQRESV